MSWQRMCSCIDRYIRTSIARILMNYANHCISAWVCIRMCVAIQSTTNNNIIGIILFKYGICFRIQYELAAKCSRCESKLFIEENEQQQKYTENLNSPSRSRIIVHAYITQQKSSQSARNWILCRENTNSLIWPKRVIVVFGVIYNRKIYANTNTTQFMPSGMPCQIGRQR